MIHGGKIAEVPEPHKRKWPESDEPRDVHIRGGQYPGYPHFYVRVEEDENPIWDASPNSYGRPDQPHGWRICWDDEEGKGKKFDCAPKKWTRRSTVAAWIKDLLLTHFEGERYMIHDGAHVLHDWDEDSMGVFRYYRDKGLVELHWTEEGFKEAP